MIAIIHMLMGITIGKYLNNFWLIIPLAIASHYILDYIPHSQPSPVKGYKKYGFKGCNKKDLLIKSIESLFGVALALYFCFSNFALFWPMFIGGFFAAAPDILIYFGYKHNSKLAKAIHLGKKSKWHSHTTPLKGAIFQIIIAVITIILLI